MYIEKSLNMTETYAYRDIVLCEKIVIDRFGDETSKIINMKRFHNPGQTVVSSLRHRPKEKEAIPSPPVVVMSMCQRNKRTR